MKTSILALAILLLSGMVLARPTTNRRKEKLLDTLLALQQDDGDDTVAIEQEDDGDGDALSQDENDEEPRGSSVAAQMQELAKLRGRAQLVVLAKMQALEKRASNNAEVQWWHHLFHLARHLFRHHRRRG